MSPPNVIAWINATIRNPETGEPFELLPCEIAFLEHCFDLDNEGRAVFPELTYSAPKKTGKTTKAGIVTLTAVALFGGKDAEAIIVSNDQEQAQSRVLWAIKRIIKASPELAKRTKVFQNVIQFENGATITAIASDAAGAAGANPVISVGDEIWGFVSESSRRLWDELVPPPTRRASWRLVTSYAGFSNESTLLEERYKHGISQEPIGPDLYAGEGHLCFWTHEPQAPWQDAKWLAQMRRSLRPNQYARLVENRWVLSESPFIDLRAWDACVDPGLVSLQSDRGLPVYIGVDASLKRDSTAVVAVTGDGDRVRLVSHRIFQPSPNQPLDFEATIEAEIIDLCNRFSVQEIRFDPWQMASVAQRLIKRGAPMVEFPQTSGNLTDASSNLYELIKGCNLVTYPDEQIRTSVSQAVAVETPRGCRIAKEKQRHKIDVVVALAMASLAAVKQKMFAGQGWYEWTQRELAAATIAAPTIQQEHGHQPVLQSLGPQHVGQKRPADWVKVIIPGDTSTFNGATGRSYTTEVDGDQRFAWMDLRDAKVALCNSFASNLAFRDANPDLLRQLESRRDIPAEVPGARASDMFAALDHKRVRW